MGSWGELPMESDAACDWSYVVRKRVLVTLGYYSSKKPTRAKIMLNAAEIRAAAAMMVATHGLIHFDKPEIQAAIDIMSELSGCEEWIGGWRSILDIRRALANDVRALRDIMPNPPVRNVIKRKSSRSKRV